LNPTFLSNKIPDLPSGIQIFTWGNIFVSETEPSKIVCLIDWQSISLSPLFLQARWPVFLEPPDDYVKGFVHSQLPSNFESMDEGDKELATYKFKQTSLTKAYETSTFLKNRGAYSAMNVPRVLRELFVRCGEVFEEGVEPLRACLIEISQSWEQRKLPGTIHSLLLRTRLVHMTLYSKNMKSSIERGGLLWSI
jgi:hypothetical protein